MNLDALRNIGYGMYVIGASKGDKLNAQIANTVFQITSQPPTVAVSINKNNLTHEYIKDSKAFSASILGEDTELSFIGHFGFKSGRDINKLEGIRFKIGETNSPVVIDNATAYVEVRVTTEVEMSSHTIFIGEVVAADVLTDKASMTYTYYQRVKRGTTPKTAPSYIAKKITEVVKLPKYKCNICGYTYDPELGDPDSGIKPGTAFEKLPDDWVCPVCGAGKSEFEKAE
jgi:flavin reductase (DIM6/NTAB) family NADH-FMN oxidoreductase RutF/rubredoxin